MDYTTTKLCPAGSAIGMANLRPAAQKADPRQEADPRLATQAVQEATEIWLRDLKAIKDHEWTPNHIRSHCEALISGVDRDDITHSSGRHASGKRDASTESVDPSSRARLNPPENVAPPTLDWDQCLVHPYLDAPYMMFNSMDVEQTKAVKKESLEALKKRFGNYHVRTEDLAEIDPPINNFRFCRDQETLREMLVEFFPKLNAMARPIPEKIHSPELILDSIWRAINDM